LRATRIGYGPQAQEVTVSAGGTATAQFTLVPAAAILEAVVVTGYGTQRREAITGSVSTIDANAANVGVVDNVNNMVQGRAAGVVDVGYVAMASASKHLDVLNGDQYRQFANGQVGVWRSDSTSACTSRPTLCQNFFKDSVAGKLGGLSPSHLAALGTANTNWE